MQSKQRADFEAVDGSSLSIGIVKTKWNRDIIAGLLDGCVNAMRERGVRLIEEVKVPGAFELPMAAQMLAVSGEFDAVVCIGCLIKGETDHYEYIAQACSNGIMQVQLKTGVPVIFGVLTCTKESQAKERAGLENGGHNHGIDWGATAVEMGLLSVQRKVIESRRVL